MVYKKLSSNLVARVKNSYIVKKSALKILYICSYEFIRSEIFYRKSKKIRKTELIPRQEIVRF